MRAPFSSILILRVTIGMDPKGRVNGTRQLVGAKIFQYPVIKVSLLFTKLHKECNKFSLYNGIYGNCTWYKLWCKDQCARNVKLWSFFRRIFSFICDNVAYSHEVVSKYFSFLSEFLALQSSMKISHFLHLVSPSIPTSWDWNTIFSA